MSTVIMSALQRLAAAACGGGSGLLSIRLAPAAADSRASSSALWQRAYSDAAGGSGDKPAEQPDTAAAAAEPAAAGAADAAPTPEGEQLEAAEPEPADIHPALIGELCDLAQARLVRMLQLACGAATAGRRSSARGAALQTLWTAPRCRPSCSPSGSWRGWGWRTRSGTSTFCRASRARSWAALPTSMSLRSLMWRWVGGVEWSAGWSVLM